MIELIGKQGRRYQQLLDGLEETRGYWKFKEEALDHLMQSTRFGRGYGPVVIVTELLLTSTVNVLQSNYLKMYTHLHYAKLTLRTV